jgi:hypothetical protein
MGAFAQGGFLGQVADQRMRAVSIPWGEYSETISQLDETELADLKDLAMKRPELIGDVLEQMRSNQEKISGQMIDIQEEKRQQVVQQAKIRQAQSELNFKYQEAKRKAVTAADKAALDRWYKNQQVKLSIARNTISAGNLQVSQGRLGVAQQNADTSRIKATTQGSGFKPISEVIASAGRSRRDIPRGQSRAKIAAALFQQYKLSVAPAQRPALRAALTKWVNTLPLQQKRGSGASNPFGALPTKG